MGQQQAMGRHTGRCTMTLRETRSPVDLFSGPGTFLKANLHSHTTESDGRLSPRDLVAFYRDAGYGLVAITDHGRFTDARSESDDRICVLPGQECHPGKNRLGHAHHVLALGVGRWIESTSADRPEETLAEIADGAALAFMAHPYWHGCESEELLDLDGWLGIEVFNTTCAVGICKGDSSVHWDEILASGRRATALAVDDCHRPPLDALQGWVQVKVAEPGPGAALAALAAGAFYASTGPEIRGIEADGQRLIVRCSPARQVSLVSCGPSGHVVVPNPGGCLEEAVLDLGAAAAYWRVVVTDHEGRLAWTNPGFV